MQINFKCEIVPYEQRLQKMVICLESMTHKVMFVSYWYDRKQVRPFTGIDHRLIRDLDHFRLRK